MHLALQWPGQILGHGHGLLRVALAEATEQICHGIPPEIGFGHGFDPRQGGRRVALGPLHHHAMDTIAALVAILQLIQTGRGAGRIQPRPRIKDRPRDVVTQRVWQVRAELQRLLRVSLGDGVDDAMQRGLLQ